MNVSEWKDRYRKTFTLKSGLEVTVRRMTPFALRDLGGAPGLQIIPEDRQLEVTEAIIRAALLSPEVGPGDNQITLKDLSMDDVNELMDAITNLSNPKEGEVPLASTA
jgi:hypothetical protein